LAGLYLKDYGEALKHAQAAQKLGAAVERDLIEEIQRAAGLPPKP
jgi:hypothetical protein